MNDTRKRIFSADANFCWVTFSCVQAKHAQGGGPKNIVLVDGVRTPFLLSGTDYKVITDVRDIYQL